jgi:hypothetical protein
LNNSYYVNFSTIEKLTIIPNDLPEKKGLTGIKNGSILTIIKDINEVLALSNEPQQLINMTLDTLTESLRMECCWVQTINTSAHSLQLTADRGFNAEMRRELSLMELGNRFSEQIVGLGNEIVIPDLSNDGRYGLSSFRAAGYRWLVAVPLMTYRVHGILGIASRSKKRLHREIVDLITVVAGLIGTALNRSDLSRPVIFPDRWGGNRSAANEPLPPIVEPPIPEKSSAYQETRTLAKKPVLAPDSSLTRTPIILEEDRFLRHQQQMKSFRSQHH